MQRTSRPTTRSQDTPLFDLVFQRISKSPDLAIPFSDYMELVLYHEEFGYYANPEAGNIGRGGDFYTSVSVGETFGFLLAHALADAHVSHFDGSFPFVIVEQGAHDARLARDIMDSLAGINTPLADSVEYRIVEPREQIRQRLEQSLAAVPGGSHIHVFGSIEEAKAPQGVFLCNELLDAFPFHCLIFSEGRWKERCVSLNEKGTGFAWIPRPLPPPLEGFAAELGKEFPEGYSTEVCPAVDEWMQESGRLFEKGLWWLIDYGYERAEYYAPGRTRGTLRCFEGHLADENPFVSPGARDITAHVDFSRVEAAAREAGLKRRQFTDQHHFLINAARPWLGTLEGRPPDATTAKRLRQFQTLTHPSLMGRQFKVMELSRGIQ